MDNLNPERYGNNKILTVLDEFRNNLQFFIKDNDLNSFEGQNILTRNGKEVNLALRLVNKNGIIVGINNSFCKLFELEEKSVLGASYLSVYDKNNSEDLQEMLLLFNRDLLKPNIDYHFKKLVITTNKKSLFIEGINTFIYTNKNKGINDDILLLTIFRDQTEEIKLSNSDTIVSLVSHPPQDACMILDLYGNINSWNFQAEIIYGYSANEVAGNSISILFTRDRKGEFKKIIQQVKNGDRIENYETINKRKNGTIIHVLYQITPVRNNKGLLSGISIVTRDVSEQKKTEIKLRKNEEMYRTLIETSPDAILMLDLNGKIRMSNKQVALVLGFESVEELQDQNIFSFFSPSDKRRIFRDARIVIETGILRNLEYTLIRKNGELVPVEMSASLILDIIGQPDSIIGIMRDITERKKSEEALKNSELRFRSIWENSNDGMRLTNYDGTIVAVNKAYCELIGLNEKELLGKSFSCIYNNEDQGIQLLDYKENFIERKIQSYTQSNFKYHRKENIILIESYSFIDLEKGEPLLLGIYHDITEMKKNEEELRNAEKFAAIGKQAAMLSHEIKTPLASIKMNMDMLFKNIPMSENKQKSFYIVQKEIKRLEALIKNVLLYSRELNLVFHSVDIEKIIDNIQDLMKPVLKKQNINLLNYLTNLKVKGDFRNLQTVFLHLIENSIESMPDGGLIEIYSKHHNSDSYSIFIKDNGCGVEADIKIFDPFFTTKSSGTGLGLTIAKNIIRQHNGDLRLVSSRPGETIFEIFFNNSLE
jgi:PAS domain S-box-containing protein